MSSKRRATNQLTKDNPRDDDDNNHDEPTGEFSRADEATLQRRIIAPLKRGRTLPSAAPSQPTPGGAFSNFSFTPKPSASSSFGPVSSTPALAPSNAPFSNFSFSPKPIQKPIQQEPENTPKPASVAALPAQTASKDILAFATSLRGLNESFKAHVNESLARDPFVDLSGCLERYREHHARIMETSKDAVRALKEGSKGNVQASAVSSMPVKSAFIATGSKWTCDVCLIQNDADKIKCAACEADKPGAKTAPSAPGGFSFSASKDAPPAGSPSGGFSFKSTSADAASPAGGFSFKSTSADATSTLAKPSPFASSVSQASKWTCGTCLIQNDAESAKCAACEADKPGSKPVTPATGGFSFSALKEPASSPSPAGGFSFNSSSAVTAPTPAPTNAPAPSFSFGGGGSSGFSFGEAATPRPTVKGVGFSFAGATSKKAVPTFNMSENPPKEASSGFSFSSKPAPQASGGFSFGGASSTPQAGGFSFAPKAVEAPKPESVATSNGPKWTCDVCMITNPDEKLKCAACEADKPKPKTTGKPAASGAQWTCDVCMITNPDEKMKCAACEADKPKPKSSTGAAPWTCDVCMITNPDEKLKCAACEADKPGTKSSAAPASLFGAAASPAPAAFSNAGGGGFSFAKSAATADPSAETNKFSFGAAPTFGSTTANAPGKFSFGAAPAPLPTKTDSGLSESSAPAPSKFSFASANSGFSFGSASTDAPAAPSTFGGFGSAPQPTTTSSFGGFGALNAPAALQSTDSQITNEDDDEDAPKDEQIDSAKLMRGAGEEDEHTVHEVRCKAYIFQKGKWDDVGLGIMKLNTNKATGKARLILRADGSGRVLLNLSVFEGMNMKAEAKTVSFMGVGEGGALNKYSFRVKDGSQGEKMAKEVDALLKK
ncbi:hypothetical protein HDU81_000320 [Chytriomyces hyalinus]|nr:hypothetical protein HDU81_000320 [Chytriomyces hyalinus]